MPKLTYSEKADFFINEFKDVLLSNGFIPDYSTKLDLYKKAIRIKQRSSTDDAMTIQMYSDKQDNLVNVRFGNPSTDFRDVFMSLVFNECTYFSIERIKQELNRVPKGF